MGANAKGGVKCGGSAEVNRQYLRYSATGGITMSGSASPDKASYRYRPKGKIVMGGSAIAKMGANATGGVKCGGSAQINRQYLRYSATGGITISGSSGPNKASYRYIPTSGLTVGGSSICLPGQHNYESIVPIIISGRAVCSFVKYINETCDVDQIPCEEIYKEKVCLSEDIYYGDCSVINGKRKSNGAILAPIIKCRQNFILPTKAEQDSSKDCKSL